MMWVGKLSLAVNGKVSGNDVAVSGVTIDSRADCSNQLFVAIAGDRFDGHDFVSGAIESGAVAVMVEDSQRIGDVGDHITVIEVADTREALGKLASWWRAQFAIPVIAVTGSVGKTTLKEMLHSIFSEIGVGLATKGNLNNDIGVPLTLLRLNANDQFAIVEMGMSALGEIEYLSKMTKPTVAVITNAAAAHLEDLGSVDNVAQAKGEIFSGLALNGTAVINQDDQFAAYWTSLMRGQVIVSFGETDLASVQGSFEMGADGVQVRVLSNNKDFLIDLPVPGKHMAINALAAATIALAANIPEQSIIEGLSKFQNVAGRMQFHRVDDVLLIDDSYNANPASMRSAIEVLVQQAGPHTLVLGDMGELGAYAESAHREIGAFAKNRGVERLFAVGQLGRYTVEAFGAGASHFEDRDGLVEALLQGTWQGAYLFKGSRSAKMDEAFAASINQLKQLQEQSVGLG